MNFICRKTKAVLYTAIPINSANYSYGQESKTAPLNKFKLSEIYFFAGVSIYFSFIPELLMVAGY